MTHIVIESKDNPKIKQLKGLLTQQTVRKKQQQTVLEGSHLCLAWLAQHGHSLQSFFCTKSALEHPDVQQILMLYRGTVFILAEALYKELSQLGTSLACMGIIDMPNISSHFNPKVDTLILDQVQDPGNVGTLLRSAAAAGVKQVLCSQGSASLWSPRVLRAGMGAHFSLNCFENIQLEQALAQFNIPVFATSSHRATSLYAQNLQQPCVWIMGNEGQGVSEYALNNAQAVTIPQPGGQESLNVAVAGSICLFEMVRQRECH